MRLKSLFYAASLIFSTAFAQDAMLTKEETINYLGRKLKEVEGQYLFFPGASSKERITNISLSKKDEILELRYTQTLIHASGGTESFQRGFRFNPAYLEHVFTPDDTATDSTVSRMSAQFRSKTVGHLTSDGEWEYHPAMCGVDFHFLSAVPENASRIRKALEHLQNLAKAEDDPFGK